MVARHKNLRLVKIISGGQTGADRGGLDAAIQLGLAHGGWCPRGRGAEDGRVPAIYDLRETPSANYPQRNEWNVRDSDATIIFIHLYETPGSRLTGQIARKLERPYFQIQLDDLGLAAGLLEAWLDFRKPSVLNVAGTRESKAPGIQKVVRDLLIRVIRGPKGHAPV